MAEIIFLFRRAAPPVRFTAEIERWSAPSPRSSRWDRNGSGCAGPAGQVYVAKDLVQADYYDAPTFTTNVSDHHVVKGTSEFYVISFNHRLAFLKASDVEVVG